MLNPWKIGVVSCVQEPLPERVAPEERIEKTRQRQQSAPGTESSSMPQPEGAQDSRPLENVYLGCSRPVGKGY